MARKQSEGTVSVDLRRTYGYRGTYYGPGNAVEIPEGLAMSLGLPIAKAETKAEAKAAEKKAAEK